MAISIFVARWLDALASRGVFDGARMIEFGPQDISCDVTWIAAKKRTPIGCAADLYKALGAREYRSVDPFDIRADFRWDMNRPVRQWQKYDVATNFGTAEHVFDVAQFFENVHNLTKPGGFMLHVLPAFGDANHGFYNMHPVFYDRIAKANGYEISDFLYVDDIHRRSILNTPFDCFPIPPGISYSDCRQSIHANFLKNAAARSAKDEPVVFDYIFVALRKTSNRQFCSPSQYDYVTDAVTGKLWNRYVPALKRRLGPRTKAALQFTRWYLRRVAASIMTASH